MYVLTALVVVPQGLFEPRYFIIPYFFFMIHANLEALPAQPGPDVGAGPRKVKSVFWTPLLAFSRVTIMQVATQLSCSMLLLVVFIFFARTTPTGEVIRFMF